MSEKLFGTDGIRGKANEFPLTPEFVARIGAAIGLAIPSGVAVIGRDTRQSGAMIEHALAAGLMAQGLDTLHVGVLTTPGIAFLTRALNGRCGISISASHNPFHDNGIKVFGGDGFKIPDAIENEIETLAQSTDLPSFDPSTSSGQAFAQDKIINYTLGGRRDAANSISAYEEFLLDAVNRKPILRGKRVVVDCNNGATFELAPRILQALGAQMIALNAQPDGVNINRGYDSLEPKLLRDQVLASDADFGVQFDGDGDRSVFVDERGNYVDGDFVLAILARDFVECGLLKTRAVVSTVMANVGLEKSLDHAGIALERTAVGDRYVTERMRATGALLGGEQSGHIAIFDQGHTTGDGLYTAIRLAEVLARRGEKLSTLAACMTRYPQILVNVTVPRKPPLEQLPQIQSQIESSRARLGDGARILVRYSGTENLARVMIEGLDSVMIALEANTLARVIQQTIQ